MALNKQRILSELGSVLSQLQNADCGCMGKLFSANQGDQIHSTNTRSSFHNGCGRGHCTNYGNWTSSQGIPCTGEAYSPNRHNSMFPHCNPRTLYHDTYNYLNENLMQPVVNEVYNDMKSLTPDNIVMNNPLGEQLNITGKNSIPVQNQLSKVNEIGHINNGHGMQKFNENLMQSEPIHCQNSSQQMPNETKNPMTYQVNTGAENQMAHLHGMNPNIVNMMQMSKPTKSGTLTQPMTIEAPQSPHGHIGVVPLRAGNPYSDRMQYSDLMHVNPETNPNTYPLSSTQVNRDQSSRMGHENMTNSNHIKNTAINQPAAHMHSHQNHGGRHGHGIKKFNEMFPGVMKGDLGFDPMAIAVQMNPKNQQRVAMETMQNIMNGNNKVFNHSVNREMKPATDGINAISNLSQKSEVNPISTQKIANSEVLQAMQGSNQIGDMENKKEPLTNSITKSYEIPQQNISTAETTELLENKQSMEQSDQFEYQEQTQRHVDINPVNLHPSHIQPSATMPQQSYQEYLEEPIFPVDNSRTFRYTPSRSKQLQQTKEVYNTLGQPVKLYPASMFNSPETNLPHTFSSQPTTPTKNLKEINVKSTVSKTSIMGNRRASKSQLQHVYHQYKGSQSLTNQNSIPAPTSSSQPLIKTPPYTNSPEAPIEKMGGDSIANNQAVSKTDKVNELVNNVPNSLHGDTFAEKSLPIMRVRNGLQDISYPSYPTTCAWSFQGSGQPRVRVSPAMAYYRSSRRY